MMARTAIPKILAFVLLAVALSVTSCGDYKPCEALAFRICTDCPDVADHWMAACLCIENGTLKENGYKCLPANYTDKVRCNAVLDQWQGEDWTEELCQILN